MKALLMCSTPTLSLDIGKENTAPRGRTAVSASLDDRSSSPIHKFPRLQMSYTNTLVEGVEGFETTSESRVRAIRASCTNTLVEPEHVEWPAASAPSPAANPTGVWGTVLSLFSSSSS